MEPLTAVTMLAAQYGLQQLIRAIGGDPSLGDLATELVSALSASEDRLGIRLAAIESRLDEVLEQRYTVATDTGLRTLVDAGTAASPTVRNDELLRARDLFREAAASARSKLQLALAERYLLLCAFALERDDAARNALARVNIAAFETVLESAEVYQEHVALSKADQRVDRQGVTRWQRGSRVREEQAAIRAAAAEAAGLAVQLLREAGVLAQRLGHDAPPDLVKFASRGTRPVYPSRRIAGSHNQFAEIGAWSVGTSPGAFSVQVGPMRVQWHSVLTTSPAQPAPPRPDPPSALRQQRPALQVPDVPQRSWLPAFRTSPTNHDVLQVDVEVHADPGLTRPVRLQLASPPEWQTPLLASFPMEDPPPQLSGSFGGTMAAGARTRRLRLQSMPTPPQAALTVPQAPLRSARLIIGGVFAVTSPQSFKPHG